MSNGLVKDVEDSLLNQKKSRRQYGDLTYPLTYCRDLADFDIWDHMFRISYCKSLTMHQFAEPPALTLDLGCGSGFWAIEAAKQWQNSRIIGFDIAEIQPNLSKIKHLRPLSRRVNWVHGNLLDGLPFPSDHFDFIRIVGMGLAIAEDEWQPVLEEVCRVLKPGAVLEIIEENLLFPSPSSQLQKAKSVSSSPSNQSPLIESPVLPQHVRLPRKRSYVFSNKSSERSSVSSTAETTSTTSKSSPIMSSLLPLLYNSRQGSTATLTATPSISTESHDEIEHPQDHTRLKIAWDAMLATRFLSPNLLSVFPFYLTSASFDFEVHAPVLIPLPPNSGVCPSPLKSFQSMGSLRHSDRTGGILFDFHPSFSNRSINADGFPMRPPLSSGPRPQPHPWGTMHLAKVTSVIKGCKDSIWLEYQKLYLKDALNILRRTSPALDEDYASQSPQNLVHKAFEIDWYNWNCDMTDRIGMRKNLLLHGAWAQPESKGDQPDCQIWRAKLDSKHDSENVNEHLVTAYNPDDLCRCVRAFTARKL